MLFNTEIPIKDQISYLYLPLANAFVRGVRSESVGKLALGQRDTGPEAHLRLLAALRPRWEGELQETFEPPHLSKLVEVTGLERPQTRSLPYPEEPNSSVYAVLCHSGAGSEQVMQRLVQELGNQQVSLDRFRHES